jgi:hypothetical protein
MYRLPNLSSETVPYPRTSDPAKLMARALPATLGFYEYWDAKRGSRRMPARGDIDPIEMKRWLAGMQMIDVFHNPRRLVYRLVGQVDIEFRGYNPTGRTVEECAVGRSKIDSLENYDIVISQRTFVYDFADFVSASGLLRSQECILLPLSDDDDVVNKVITYAEVGRTG